MNIISISIASGWPISPVMGSRIWAIANPICRSAIRPQNLTVANTETTIIPIARPYMASLLSSNIASNAETCLPELELMANGSVKKKKNAISKVNDTLILTGMLLHPKTGRTRKNAEILVKTIAKPSSLSIIGSINHCPMFWM